MLRLIGDRNRATIEKKKVPDNSQGKELKGSSFSDFQSLQQFLFLARAIYGTERGIHAAAERVLFSYVSYGVVF